MRFITEFKLTEQELKGSVNHLYYYKKDCYQRMESMMNPLWQNPVNGDKDRYKLEIEAFPMDKWIEFKRRLMDALPDYDVTSRTRIMNALVELESHPTTSTI